jgi:hypothetical protein
MKNVPQVKLGIVAVSRDCFPIELSRKRRTRVVVECRAKAVRIVEIKTIVENEKDALRALDEVRQAGVNAKRGGTYVCIEGPQFSTKAESNVYRSWGMDIIGMTNLQEAKLAREAELCYATVAMVTDYDCWHPAHESVTVEQVVANLQKNAENAGKVVRHAVAGMPSTRRCKCGQALAAAILTERDKIPPYTRQKLGLLLDRYLGKQEGA